MPRRTPILAGLLLALVTVLLVPTAAVRAHTGLDSSSPAQDETVDGPLGEVVLDFTGTPTAIDDGIVVAATDGTQHVPVDVSQDGLRIAARFDPPLPEGSYTLTWQVRSDDTHVVDGSFSFGVLAATSAAPVTTSGPASTEPADVDESAVALLPPPPPPAATLAAASDEAQSTARLGRLLLFPSAVVAIGVLALALWVYSGRVEDLASLLRLVRWLGVGVALGAIVELAGLEVSFGSFGEVLEETAGRAALARFVGGVLLVTGFGAVLAAASGDGSRRRSLSAAVRADPEAERAHHSVDLDVAASGPGTSWRPGSRDVPGLVGAVVVLLSFAFDGHTLSEGPRALHAFASVAHVAAASVWAGGLVALAVVLWRRHRDGVASGALQLTLRFSVTAMVSLAVAGVAGLAMALFIDSDVAGYVSTDWGRLLLVKLALVGAAAAVGAYNHFRVLPALDATPDDPDVLARARTTVTTEAGLLVGAAAVSGLLVAASIL